MSNVDEIKQRIDIVDLVSEHVQLRKAGRAFVGLCPFHQERTPSFSVDPARQTWHCFGACGTGGDIFAFVMKRQGCDFREALRTLAERAGVELEARRDMQAEAQRARLFEINEAAAAFFHHELLQAPGAEAARAYLAERRLSPASVDAFQIGYAPNAWESLTRHLEARGCAARDLRAAGVAVEGERGVYDRFRHRLMFPIRDERGRIAGFGGRVLPGEAVGGGDAHAKYVNTPQSPIFDKGTLLYALDRAKDAVRAQGAVIVEGYMDAIAAHEHGYTNVVASMGTALTERQVGLLKRYTRNLVLALDADAAGSEATLRGVRVVADAADREATPQVNWRGVVRMQETVAADIRVLTLPAGRDPDDVIRAEPERWPRLVAEAKPVLDHLFEAAAGRHDLTSPRERSALSAELLPLVAAVADKVVQSHYVQRLARLAQVDEETLRAELWRPSRSASRATARASSLDAGASGAQRSSVRERKESFCLALLFRYPELRAEGSALSAELFGQSENRALFDAWLAWSDKGESTVGPAGFEGSLAPDLRPHFERVLNLELPPYDDDASRAALRSTVWGIEQERLRAEKRLRAAALADVAARDGDEIAERARSGWQSARAVAYDPAGDADPAAAFVEDMETGLKVHHRILEQQRKPQRPAR
ncbi:MAG TPA: DNA primase [Dehalococcoidia bacterium]|nr:DNA primase [Dehalococcoidia bacterium]